MRVYAALEQGVAVDDAVMRRDRGRHPFARAFHELHRVRAGDMFQHDLQPGKIARKRPRYPLDEHRLAVEDIDIAVRHLAMDAQHHADALHPLQHGADIGDIGNASRAVGGGAGRIQLGRGEYAFRVPTLDLVRRDLVGQIGGHQRLEIRALGQRQADAVAIALRRSHAGDGR